MRREGIRIGERIGAIWLGTPGTVQVAPTTELAQEVGTIPYPKAASERPTNIPQDAVCLPGTGNIMPYQMQVISSFMNLQDHDNSQRLAQYNLACSNWLANNEQRRALHLPLTPKPEQRVRRTVRIMWVPDDQQTINLGAADAWVWVEDDGLLGKHCPDLALESPPAGVIHVGQKLAPGFYRCCQDDTAPFGTIATAEDDVKVRKVAWIGGLAHYEAV